ncbi:unnamed protein product [Notodromas monacha]|nr:unnamed protein product [Notodromas monacha]CAG0919197.1 unnamed protein product [Notodromas monacha]
MKTLNISKCFDDVDSKDKVEEIHWWHDPRRPHPEDSIETGNHHMDIFASPRKAKEIQTLLKRSNLTAVTLIDDVHRLFKRGMPKKRRRSNRMTWTNYQSAATINRFLDLVAKKVPHATTEVIGKTAEGRELKVLKLNTNNAAKAFWIDGGIHAREWISPAVVTFIIKEFVSNYSRHKTVIDSYQWYFLPLMNPDGYEYSRTKDRMWRKTRSPSLRKGGCVGVDANRNWNHKWMVVGASQDTCSEVYAGPYPESEKCVVAVRDYVLKKLKPRKDVQLVAFYTFHSYYQGWMSPWGWTYATPQRHDELIRVAKAGVNAIKRVSGNVFVTGTAGSLTGKASGASDDWAFGVAKIPFVYTIELRDRGRYKFVLPARQIQPSGVEMVAGVEASAYTVIRTVLDSAEKKLELMKTLNISKSFDEVDSKDKVEEIHWWHDPRRPHPEDSIETGNQHMDIFASPRKAKEIRTLFNQNNLTVETLVDDVHRLFKRGAFRKRRQTMQMSWTEYHSADTINKFLDDVAMKFHYATTEVIGRTAEGRELKVLKLNTNNADKAFWIDGGIHAREWISPAVVTFIIHEFVNNYCKHQDVIDSYQWHFLPIVNPDGYEYSRTNDRMWRKTRSSSLRKGGCVGVDANRNWNHKWMVVGASQDTCSEVYAGPYPESEKCVVAVRDYVLKKLKPRKDVQLVAFYTFHSYYQGWMSPWGWTEELPERHKELIQVAQKGVEAVKSVYGTEFVTGNAGSLTGTASGASDDWAFGVAKIPFVYTIELRDRGRYKFVLPADQIHPSGVEMVAGVKASALEILKILK